MMPEGTHPLPLGGNKRGVVTRALALARTPWVAGVSKRDGWVVAAGRLSVKMHPIQDQISPSSSATFSRASQPSVMPGTKALHPSESITSFPKGSA